MTDILIKRCPWGQTDDELMQNYHDHEWGKLNLDDDYLFEMLILELFQAGLNWNTILHKRENFRKAFKNFDVAAVAQMTDTELASLMQDTSIIRNKRKIAATVQNAKAVLISKEKYGSFAKYIQSFVATSIIHHPERMEDVPAKNEITAKMSKQMKKDGFNFVGPVTLYSYLQGIGLINDHLESCAFKFNG